MNPTIRPLTTPERHALAAARLIAIEYAPYLAHAIFAMRPVAAEGLDTFAVDRHWRLYLDPARLSEWGPATSGAVLVHEVNHLIRDHAGRADALGSSVDHVRWNYATDAAINDGLIDTGLPLPEWVVTPESLGMEPGGIEEAYYGAMPAQPAPTEVGCGSGAGDPHQPWEIAPADPNAPGMDTAEIAITVRRVAHDVADAVTKGRGTIPAGLSRWAKAELAPPTVPWRRVLAGMVRHAATLTAGRLTYSYSRPGRRRLPGIITPAMRAPRVTAAVVIDTSGSMSRAELDAALAEVNGVIKAVGGEVVTLSCDAETGAPQRVRNADAITLTGGGGTDMRVGIEAAEALRPTPNITIVITDGGTPWPAQPGRSRLIVALTHGALRSAVPSWARTVAIHTAT